MTTTTKDNILQAAASVFAQQGVAGATLRQIADQCGIQAPSIFHHFKGGKQELYDSINQQMITASMNMLNEAVNAGSDDDVLTRLTHSLWHFFAANHDYAAMSMRDLLSPDNEHFAAGIGDSQAVIEAAIAFFEQQLPAKGVSGVDARALIMWLSINVMGFHALRGLHQVIYGNQMHAAAEETYLSMIQTSLASFITGDNS